MHEEEEPARADQKKAVVDVREKPAPRFIAWDTGALPGSLKAPERTTWRARYLPSRRNALDGTVGA